MSKNEKTELPKVETFVCRVEKTPEFKAAAEVWEKLAEKMGASKPSSAEIVRRLIKIGSAQMVQDAPKLGVSDEGTGDLFSGKKLG